MLLVYASAICGCKNVREDEDNNFRKCYIKATKLAFCVNAICVFQHDDFHRDSFIKDNLERW